MLKMAGELKALIVLITLTLTLSTQQWDEEPGYKEVNPGGEIVMVCKVKNKKGECRWERDNTPIAAFAGKYEWAGDQSKGDCSLRILQANLEYDNGGWVCQVTATSFKEKDTLISHPANLVVRAPPTSVHLRVPGESSPFTGPLVATSGSEVEVECVANGGNPPPGLQWYIGGRRWEGNTEEINQETGVTVSRVRLPVTRGDDKKEVRCEVVHEALTDILEEKTILEIHYLPQVSMSLSEDISDYTEGDTATVSCIADANPKADILWYRDGSGEIVGRRETLKITNIKRNQAGVYICKANNSVGQSDTKKIDIQVKYAPVIISVGPKANVTQLLRSKLELTCEASGNPLPQYTWIHHTETESTVRGHEKNLIITGLTYRDQGQYECRATNFIRGEEKFVKSTLIAVNVTGAPKVKERRSEVFILRGTDAIVKVEFCADPLPKQTWHLGGPGHSVLLSSECSHEKFSVLKEEPSTREDCYISTLRIEGAEKTDSREYVLHLENYLGLETHTVRVNIGEMIAQETLIGGIVGGAITIITILIALVCCVRRCCKSEKQLKQDIESNAGWSSQSDVSISTDPHSEVSTGTGHTTIPDLVLKKDEKKYVQYLEHLSVSQECIKPPSLHSPTPSNLTDRPPSSTRAPSQVSYNDLCFPKTSNYGSMRKNGRCDIAAKLNLPPNSVYQFH